MNNISHFNSILSSICFSDLEQSKYELTELFKAHNGAPADQIPALNKRLLETGLIRLMINCLRGYRPQWLQTYCFAFISHFSMSGSRECENLLRLNICHHLAQLLDTQRPIYLNNILHLCWSIGQKCTAAIKFMKRENIPALVLACQCTDQNQKSTKLQLLILFFSDQKNPYLLVEQFCYLFGQIIKNGITDDLIHDYFCRIVELHLKTRDHHYALCQHETAVFLMNYASQSEYSLFWLKLLNVMIFIQDQQNFAELLVSVGFIQSLETMMFRENRQIRYFACCLIKKLCHPTKQIIYQLFQNPNTLENLFTLFKYDQKKIKMVIMRIFKSIIYFGPWKQSVLDMNQRKQILAVCFEQIDSNDEELVKMSLQLHILISSILHDPMAKNQGELPTEQIDIIKTKLKKMARVSCKQMPYYCSYALKTIYKIVVDMTEDDNN